MGSAKVSSQGLSEEANRWTPIEQVIAGLEHFPSRPAYFEKNEDRKEKKRCEISLDSKRTCIDGVSSLGCLKESSLRKTF
jgi:hypothetical protein